MKLNVFGVSLAASVATAVLFPGLALRGAVAESAPVADPAPAPVAVAPQRPSNPGNVDALTLIGTASSPTSDYAFFDSNRAEYRILVHRGEHVGNLVVESIATDHVCLKDGSQQIVLPITQQVQRPEHGSWQLAAANTQIQWPDVSPAPEPTPAPAPKAITPTKGTVVASKAIVPTMAPAISDKQLRKLDKVALDSIKPPKPPKDLVRAAEEKVFKTIAKEMKRLK